MWAIYASFGLFSTAVVSVFALVAVHADGMVRHGSAVRPFRECVHARASAATGIACPCHAAPGSSDFALAVSKMYGCVAEILGYQP